MNRKYTPRRHEGRDARSAKSSQVAVPNLASVRRIPKTQLVPGAVVWAHVPYEEDDGEKTRPAVVKGLRGRDLTLLPGTTSQSRNRFPGLYVEVEDLASAGLSRATAIRTTPVTVDIIDVINIAGELSETDAARTLGRFGQVA